MFAVHYGMIAVHFGLWKEMLLEKSENVSAASQ